MSIRVVRFKKKVAQARRVGITDLGGLITFGIAKSDGHTTIFGSVDSLDDEGNPQKAGKRYPGRATGKVGTLPPNDDTFQRLARLAK